MLWNRLVLVSMVSGFVACGDDATTAANPPGGSTTDLVIQGTVRQAGSSGGQPSPLDGATVRATIDRNHDGSISAAEAFPTETAADGSYRLQVAVAAGETVVIGFDKSGNAPVYRTLVAGPRAQIVVDVTLKELKTLDCQGPRCTIDAGALSLTGLPTGFGGAARVFNPVTETEMFPGNFNDEDGNLLVSGVFSTMAIEDDAGDPITTLSTPARLCMTMPRDTWPVVVDINTGNSEIDVPLFSFDEVAGTWVREGDGILEDGDGNALTPADLPNIKDGSFAGIVQACGMVGHFSSWNVDWPIATHGCVGGTVLDPDGNPAAGATVYLRGVSYTGTSTPVTVGDDGHFCLDAMRSEAPGEEINNNGTTGETTRIAIRVVYQGKVYDAGEHDMATAQASCNDPACLDLGPIQLTDALELIAALCTINGTVRDTLGTLQSGVSVYAWDESVPDEVNQALCFDGTSYLCTFAGTTDGSGAFSIITPVMDGVTVFGTQSSTPDASTQIFTYGERTVSGCPTTVVTLTLDQGYVSVTLTVGVSGQVVSWSPSTYTATYILVTDAASNIKWMVTSEASDIASPVTYGVVPAGALQVFPSDSSTPPALAAGDMITVQVSGASAYGLPLIGSGTAVVP